MNITEINKTALWLTNKYLNKNILNELKEYTVFFTKDLLQPETSGTYEDLMRLCSLAIDLQAIRERTVVILLDAKKTKTRLKNLQKELISTFYTEYKKQTNKENRELFVYKNSKILDTALSQSRLICESCEIVISNIDSHVWVLKNNSQVLSRVAKIND